MKTRLLLLVIASALTPARVRADSAFVPKQLQGVGIAQELNATVPLDLPFRDEYGKQVRLRDYFEGRPVLLVPVYYTCPMLCSQILSGVVEGLRPLDLKPGRDLQVVAFSFNPAETSADAFRKKQQSIREYSGKQDDSGWHFLTGTQSSIESLTQAIGFHYRYDPATRMFLHASGVVVLTPEGKIARYFYGVQYEPKDFSLGLIEASHRQIGSPVQQVLLFCYHYDPNTGRYGATVMGVLRAAAVLALIVMSAGLAILWRFDMRRHRGEA